MTAQRKIRLRRKHTPQFSARARCSKGQYKSTRRTGAQCGASAWDGPQYCDGATGGGDFGYFERIGTEADALAWGGLDSAAALGAGGEEWRGLDDLFAREYGSGCGGGGAGTVSGAVCGAVYYVGAPSGGVAGGRAVDGGLVGCLGGALAVADEAVEGWEEAMSSCCARIWLKDGGSSASPPQRLRPAVGDPGSLLLRRWERLGVVVLSHLSQDETVAKMGHPFSCFRCFAKADRSFCHTDCFASGLLR